VIAPGKNVAVELQKIACILKCTEKFRVFVEYNSVTESISKLDFAEPAREAGGSSVLNWLHGAKPRHSTTCNQIAFIALETGVFPGRISVDEEYPERGVDWKIINEFRRWTVGSISECTSRACVTHAFDVGPHLRPIITKA